MQLQQLGEILGGEKTLGIKLENKMDLVELSYKGITKNALAHLAEHLSFSWKQVAELLPMSERTLQRYSSDQYLTPAVSEQVLHVAAVLAKGLEVFQEQTSFLLWLNTPHQVFSGKCPITLMNSGFGTELVLEELGRIQFGVYS